MKNLQDAAVSAIVVAILNVRMRRDANTIIVVTVPEYEIAILKSIHGKENVNLVEGEKTPTVAGEREVDPRGEYSRLKAKYGPVVEKVYGDDDGDRMAEKVHESAEKFARYKASQAPATEKKETKAEKKLREAQEAESKENETADVSQ